MPSDREIWTIVEALRERFPVLGADRLPLDLISFAELELKLDLIPDDGGLIQPRSLRLLPGVPARFRLGCLAALRLRLRPGGGFVRALLHTDW
jgi:hypothetical protein